MHNICISSGLGFLIQPHPSLTRIYIHTPEYQTRIHQRFSLSLVVYASSYTVAARQSHILSPSTSLFSCLTFPQPSLSRVLTHTRSLLMSFDRFAVIFFFFTSSFPSNYSHALVRWIYKRENTHPIKRSFVCSFNYNISMRAVLHFDWIRSRGSFLFFSILLFIVDWRIDLLILVASLRWSSTKCFAVCEYIILLFPTFCFFIITR